MRATIQAIRSGSPAAIFRCSAGDFNGNKIVLYYSCDPGGANPWTRYGPVIELDTPVPVGSTPGNPSGQGHPNAQFIHGQVYITHCSHNNNADGMIMHKYTALALAADGVNFTKYPFVQTTVGQETHYLERADTFLGVGSVSLNHFIFWGKDIGSMRSWLPQGVWAHLMDEMANARREGGCTSWAAARTLCRNRNSRIMVECAPGQRCA